MTTDIDRETLDAPRGQAIRQRMNARARSGRAVNEDGDPPDPGTTRRIMAVGQFGAVARLKKLEPRHGTAIHFPFGYLR